MVVRGPLRLLRQHALTVCAYFTLLFAGLVIAEGMTIEETIKARQHQYRDLGGAFKSVRDQLRLKRPNIYLIQPTVQQIKDLSEAQYAWFPPGTGPEAGIETEARSEIWEDPEGFAEAQKAFAAVIPKFLEFAYANDIEGLKKQVQVVGQACKNCHDTYREED